jgi:hypothetical protein
MDVAASAKTAESTCSCGEGCGCGRPAGLLEADRLARHLNLERSHASLRQIEQVRDLFTRIVLRGDSMETLQSAATELIGREVRIDETVPVPDKSATFAIEAGDHILGSVRVGPDAQELTEIETAIARQVAVAAAMLLLTHGSPRWPSQPPAVDASVDSTGLAAWPETWLRGLVLEESKSFVTIALTVDSDGAPVTERVRLEVALHAVDRALQGRRIPAFVGSQSNEVVVIVPLSDRSRATAVSRSLIEQVRSFLRMAGPNYRMNTGLSEIALDSTAVAQRVDEARMAARIGRVLNGPDAVTTFKDLRAFPAMIEAVGGHGDGAFDELHERYLGSLVRYEARTGLPLLQTLSVLFDENGNVSGAARSLQINRQSLLYRLRKIESMCEVDLADPSDRFALELAVRSWVVREALSPTPDGTGSATAASSIRVGTPARVAAG